MRIYIYNCIYTLAASIPGRLNVYWCIYIYMNEPSKKASVHLKGLKVIRSYLKNNLSRKPEEQTKILLKLKPPKQNGAAK